MGAGTAGVRKPEKNEGEAPRRPARVRKPVVPGRKDWVRYSRPSTTAMVSISWFTV